MKLFLLILLSFQVCFAGPVIPDGSVSATKLASNAVIEAKIADNAVTSAKIASGTIVSADISASAAIPYSKLNLTGSLTSGDFSPGVLNGSSNYVITSSSGNFSNSSTSFVTVTNQSATITTTGGPVLISVQPDGSHPAGGSYTNCAANCYLALFRDSTKIIEFLLGGGSATTFSFIGPVMDIPASGTYTYTFQMKNASGLNMNFDYLKTVVREE